MHAKVIHRKLQAMQDRFPPGETLTAVREADLWALADRSLSGSRASMLLLP